MHPPATVTEALRLHHLGASVTQVSRRLGVPRRTVNEWVLGRSPGSGSAPCHRDAVSRDAPAAYVYLLGLYLGDGWISEHPRGVLKLRLALDARYPGIIDEAAAAIGSVLSGGRANSTLRPRNTVEVYAYSRQWAELFPQHGPGKKHERPIRLESWQHELGAGYPERLLRGLVHSDGCRAMNTGTNWRHPRYSFSNRSSDIRAIFTWACELAGLHWTAAPHTIYVSRKADVAHMDTFIGPKT